MIDPNRSRDAPHRSSSSTTCDPRARRCSGRVASALHEPVSSSATGGRARRRAQIERPQTLAICAPIRTSPAGPREPVAQRDRRVRRGAARSCAHPAGSRLSSRSSTTATVSPEDPKPGLRSVLHDEEARAGHRARPVGRRAARARTRRGDRARQRTAAARRSGCLAGRGGGGMSSRRPDRGRSPRDGETGRRQAARGCGSRPCVGCARRRRGAATHQTRCRSRGHRSAHGRASTASTCSTPRARCDRRRRR